MCVPLSVERLATDVVHPESLVSMSQSNEEKQEIMLHCLFDSSL